jgi:geranylgeranyl pyrophosphate synthase
VKDDLQGLVHDTHNLVNQYLETSPVLADLPDIQKILRIENKEAGVALWTWALPAIGSLAVKGDLKHCPPAGAIVLCLGHSAKMTDAVMDGDDIPDITARNNNKDGIAANYAIMLLGCAGLFVGESIPKEKDQALVHHEISKALPELCTGQHLKLSVGRSEEKYWEAITRGNAAFFSLAFFLGVFFGGNREIAEKLNKKIKKLGEPIARFVQIGDDLGDVFESKDLVDWKEGQASLPILYGFNGQYPEKDRFLELYPKVHSDPEALNEARQILVRSGAIVFCYYHLIENYKQIKQCIKDLNPPDPEPILAMANLTIEPLRQDLKQHGYDLETL